MKRSATSIFFNILAPKNQIYVTNHNVDGHTVVKYQENHFWFQITNHFWNIQKKKV